MPPRARRVVVLVLDSVGVGELPDADRYGDAGSNTLGNVDDAVGGLALPTLGCLGIGNVLPLSGTPPADRPAGAFGKMREVSPGKDSTTGHWEIAGVLLDRPFPTYPDGFPAEVVAAFEEAIGRPVIGNVVASGTDIVERLGEEHVRTGQPILYTSADSVFQLAAHVDVVPLEQLYAWCRAARGIMRGDHEVGRVIARPFAGPPGAFVRTKDRRDFAVPPPGPTILDAARAAGLPTVAVGKVWDLFAGRGIGRSLPEKTNADSVRALLSVLREGPDRGLVFATLVDFDMLFGHRNDPAGYAKALVEFDGDLARILDALGPGDVLFVTADHGNDPTTPSTDHSREHVPVLVAGAPVAPGVDLGTRGTFADLGATVRDLLALDSPPTGTSFAGDLTGG